MSTIQIVGIAAAAVVVLLLVIALVVTRKSGGDEAGEAREADAGASFLDSAPSDTLAKLGRPEHAASPAVIGGDDLGLDWDHSAAAAAAPEPTMPDETETTGELPVIEPEAAEAAEEQTADPAATESEAAEPEVPAAEAEAPAASEPAAATQASDNLVPLSSIIVTTSTKMVDLDDPEIRHMLTDLVTFEMDQATQFRQQGQTIDAVLQLTEAEKVCNALGKRDMAREIRDMMRGLKA